MEKKKINKLFNDNTFDELTSNERAKIDHWYLKEAAEREYLDNQDLDKINQEIWNQVSLNTSIVKKKRLISLVYKISAACILVLAGIFTYYSYQNDRALLAKKDEIIKPGGNKATLILANGKRIILDNIANGNIDNESGIRITKAKNGLIIYQVSSTNDTKIPPKINQIETPHGGQYQVNLPDGSKVWLNSSSTISFPTYFIGNDRKVEITGEAYFEIAHNKHMHFKVYTTQPNGVKQEVEVLGTHFNINAYPNETNVKTTLVEGSVKLSIIKSNKSILSKHLIPSQQAYFDEQKINLQEVNANDIVAWKDGLFVFNNERIADAMKQFSRWYDVEINYEGNLDDVYLAGSVSRNNTLEQSLHLLELTGNFKFKVNGRRVTLMQ